MLLTSICQRLFPGPQSIIMRLYAVGLRLVRCLPIIHRRITKISLITAFPATLDAGNEREESVGFLMTTLEMGWISNMHLPIKLIECELQTVNFHHGKNEPLVFEDWTMMIFLPFYEEKHRQLILEDPVLEQLLTALYGCLLWTSNEEWTIIGSSYSFPSLSFRDMG